MAHIASSIGSGFGRWLPIPPAIKHQLKLSEDISLVADTSSAKVSLLKILKFSADFIRMVSFSFFLGTQPISRGFGFEKI